VLLLYASATRQCPRRHHVFKAVPLFRSSGQIMLPRYPMNGLNSFDEIDGEYSLAPADDLIGYWRSNVKVTAGRQGQIL